MQSDDVAVLIVLEHTNHSNGYISAKQRSQTLSSSSYVWDSEDIKGEVLEDPNPLHNPIHSSAFATRLG